MKEFDLKKQKLTNIEERLRTNLGFSELSKLQNEYDGIRDFFQDERSQNIENELCVKRILYLKEAWNKQDDDYVFLKTYIIRKLHIKIFTNYTLMRRKNSKIYPNQDLKKP